MSQTRKIRKNIQLPPSNPAQQPPTTPPQPDSPQDQEIQRQVGKAFSSLVVSMRSLNTQVNALGLQNQTVPLLLATLEEIDQNLGEVTDRMWALRSIVEAESAKEGS